GGGLRTGHRVGDAAPCGVEQASGPPGHRDRGGHRRVGQGERREAPRGALVEAGRVDEARREALPAANRLIAVASPSRQVAGLRLAIARLTAVADGPDVVLTALEPAAQDAADSNVPELESACRSMLGELHEAAGRLDTALAAVRAAMAAERRDRDRGARLRSRLAAAAASWAGRPSRGTAPAGYLDNGSSRHVAGHGANPVADAVVAGLGGEPDVA